MDLHSETFLIDAHYVPDALPVTIGVLICVVILGLLLIVGGLRYGGETTKVRIGFGVAAFGALAVAGACTVALAILLDKALFFAPKNINDIIAAPAGCTVEISSSFRPYDALEPHPDLPEGQRQAWYYVDASCEQPEDLEQLLQLHGSVIFLDQQPLTP